MRQFLGLPIDASAQGPGIDNLLVMVHWLMFVLFIGWLSYFIFILIRFRQSRSPNADYHGVKGHFSSYVEVGVALTEVVLLVGFAFPVWATRVNKIPDEKDATLVRMVAEQFAWNVHYPGPDGIFGRSDINLVSSDNPLGLDAPSPRNDTATRPFFCSFADKAAPTARGIPPALIPFAPRSRCQWRRGAWTRPCPCCHRSSSRTAPPSCGPGPRPWRCSDRAPGGCW